MKPNKDLRRDEVVSVIRADPFCGCYRYRKFCRSLRLAPANDHIKRYCAKVTSKKSKLSRDGREGEVSGEGGFELGCSCSPTRNLLPPPSDSFFQRRLFFSREKKSASSRSTVHTIRFASAVYVLQVAREGKNHKHRKTRSLSENNKYPPVKRGVFHFRA